MSEPTIIPNSLIWSDEAHAHLLAVDERMAGLARRQGPLLRELNRDYFSRLVRAIIGQQISGKAAAAIYRRLSERAGEPVQPDILDALSDDEIRGCGLSVNKLAAVRDLARHALDGRLDLDHLETLPDEEVRTRLVAVRGIGRWTADMFLMFSLGRPDVLPADDLGVRNAVKRLYRLESAPTPARVRELAREHGWHPYATAASMYLWRSLEDPEIETEGWWNA
ncbi:MAG: DNA-3-methyladenine glycosylase [Armatimonadetes bacterium]|nr:DNA-3-methyladenine glycosylase [Armatimonadota bacterium]